MSLTILPTGDAIDLRHVGLIQYVPSKGVAIKDAAGNLAAWLDEPDELRGILIRDELIAAAAPRLRGRSHQPNWSALLGEPNISEEDSLV